MIETASSSKKDLLSAVALFVFIFVLWQVYWQIVDIIKPDYPFDHLLFLSIPCLGIVAYALVVKTQKASFRKHGWRKPTITSTSKTIKLGVGFAAIYLAMVLASGLVSVLATGNISEGFEVSSSLQTPIRIANRIFFGVVYAIVFALVYELIFRGYIFRSLVRHYGFFTSLYASAIMFSLHQISIRSMLTMSTEGLVTYIFMEILTVFASGLFLGFFFYKIGWSLLGPIIFQLGVIFFVKPDPLVASTSTWWMVLTFQVVAYVALILIVDGYVKEPLFRRKKYGLES